MTVACVTIATNHYFAGNIIRDQHKLRYQSVIQRQKWDVPQYNELEYDQYDNPASTYLIWRDESGHTRGSTRLYPTDRPYMLSDFYADRVTQEDLPNDPAVLEGSRFCIDKNLPPEQRLQAARELLLAYLEYGLDHGVTRIVGLMHLIYWKNLFFRHGWAPVWLGDVFTTAEKHKVRTGYVHISRKNLETVRERTGIKQRILSYRDIEDERRAA